MQDEMGNTIRYLEHKALSWDQLAEGNEEAGHVCYARRQANMWKSLAEQARVEFHDVIEEMPSTVIQ